MLKVEVVYARPGRRGQYALELEAGITVREAIERSGVLTAFPEIDLACNRVAVFGTLVTLGSPLRDGDRVEILRPLAADPKEARRRRAARPAR